MTQICLLMLVLAQSLDSIRPIPDAEKRYQMAFDVASRALDDARGAHKDSKPMDTKQFLDEAAEATEFALSSLEAMGKPPYKNTKNYKKAELRTREMLRRIETLLKDASVDDRDALQSAQNRVNTVHEKVLEGVMSKK